MSKHQILSRQSFLGKDSRRILGERRVAIVGLGGGGSHVAQQLAHAGVSNLWLFDPDIVKWHNLNRTVGAEYRDVRNRTSKVAASRRLVRRICPEARVRVFKKAWGNATAALRNADVIVGCVDSYSARYSLEAFSRRFLIPYVDIGMDVYEEGTGFRISGQVISSIAGAPCMTCLGFLTEEKLAKEALGYGAAGGMPQVVWSNGALASVAAGTVVRMLTPWYSSIPNVIYLEYDGNENTIWTSNRLKHLSEIRCSHFTQLSEVGDPFWSKH